MQLPKRNEALKVKKPKFALSRVIHKKLPQREFSSQNISLHNFLATQPIHTNCNSIDAARKEEYDVKLKMSKIQSREANSTKIPP
jgi:hypothetical protein